MDGKYKINFHSIFTKVTFKKTLSCHMQLQFPGCFEQKEPWLKNLFILGCKDEDIFSLLKNKEIRRM